MDKPNILPEIFKVLEVNQYEPAEEAAAAKALNFAFVEGGLLIAACKYMIFRVDLRLYFTAKEVKEMEGIVLDRELMEILSSPVHSEIRFKDGLFEFTSLIGDETSLDPCGVMDGRRFVTYAGTSEEQRLTYPKYKHFVKNFVNKAYPQICINLETLAIVSGCFKQSMLTERNKSEHLRLELPESSGEFQPTDGRYIRVTPFFKDHGLIEEAIFAHTHLTEFDELETLL